MKTHLAPFIQIFDSGYANLSIMFVRSYPTQTSVRSCSRM